MAKLVVQYNAITECFSLRWLSGVCRVPLVSFLFLHIQCQKDVQWRVNSSWHFFVASSQALLSLPAPPPTTQGKWCPLVQVTAWIPAKAPAVSHTTASAPAIQVSAELFQGYTVRSQKVIQHVDYFSASVYCQAFTLSKVLWSLSVVISYERNGKFSHICRLIHLEGKGTIL